MDFVLVRLDCSHCPKRLVSPESPTTDILPVHLSVGAILTQQTLLQTISGLVKEDVPGALPVLNALLFRTLLCQGRFQRVFHLSTLTTSTGMSQRQPSQNFPKAPKCPCLSQNMNLAGASTPCLNAMPLPNAQKRSPSVKDWSGHQLRCVFACMISSHGAGRL